LVSRPRSCHLLNFLVRSEPVIARLGRFLSRFLSRARRQAVSNFAHARRPDFPLRFCLSARWPAQVCSFWFRSRAYVRRSRSRIRSHGKGGSQIFAALLVSGVRPTGPDSWLPRSIFLSVEQYLVRSPEFLLFIAFGFHSYFVSAENLFAAHARQSLRFLLRIRAATCLGCHPCISVAIRACARFHGGFLSCAHEMFNEMSVRRRSFVGLFLTNNSFTLMFFFHLVVLPL
jgi:hypothetical protein